MGKLIALFKVFFHIGAFGFGGGYAMLPLIFQSVQRFGMMSAADFSRLVALSQATPGPIALNAATYVGFNYAGLPGAAAATLAVALPSFIYMLLAMRFMERFSNGQALRAALAGVRPITVGLVAAAAVFTAEGALFRVPAGVSRLLSFSDFRPSMCLICVGALLAAGAFRVNSFIVILAAAALGAVATGAGV